ncbi:MAG: hypothetical protein V4735_02985 [Pseudomonadota bacterium]
MEVSFKNVMPKVAMMVIASEPSALPGSSQVQISWTASWCMIFVPVRIFCVG